MGTENRIGVHTSSYYKWIFPESVGSLTEKIRAAGGDFCAYIPNTAELLPGKANPNISIPVEYIDEAWLLDRRVEKATPFISKQPNVVKMLLSLSYPEQSVKNALSQFPDASLIERWPIFPQRIIRDNDRKRVIALRNAVMEKWSNTTSRLMITLDIHSPNIGLTPNEIKDWLFEDSQNRKLAVTALAADERIKIHYFSAKSQVDLIKPLLPWVNVLILKPEPVETDIWGKTISKDEVYKGIMNPKDKNSKYASILRSFISEVGKRTNGSLDLIIKDKNVGGIEIDGKKISKPEFILNYVEFAKMVVSTL